MGMNTDAVQRLYVAYFNRPADPASLAVYEAMLPSDRVATQAELEAIAETYFSPSQEYLDTYAGMSESQIVNALYQNLFGREAEPAGLLAWTQALIAGTETIASIALQLTYSAQGTDADSIAAKIKAANAFTTEVASSTDNITGYAGNDAAASARAWLATVTTDASADTAIAGVEAAVAAAIAADSTPVDPVATFSLASDVTASNEGTTVYFTLTTENVAAGTQYSYSLSGTNITNGDVDGSLAGTATIDADGKAVIAVDFSNDELTEGTETITLSVAGQTAAVNINDTSLTPTTPSDPVATFSLASDVTASNEGTTVYFTLTTTNVAAGTQYSYSLSGTNITNGDVDGSLAGTATIDADGKAVIAVDLSNDQLTEGAETITLSVAGQTAAVDINDTSLTVTPTYALTASQDPVGEGETVTFTMTTTGVAEGSQLAWSVTGLATTDVVGGTLTGLATVGADGRATVSIAVAADAATEGAETMTFSMAGETLAVAVTDDSTDANLNLSLTTGVDNLSGNGGDDTFSAALSGAVATLGSLDTLDGGGGSDTLTVELNGVAVTPASVSNIETVNVTSSANNSDLDFVNFSGVTTVTSAASTGNLTFTNMALATNVSIANTDQTHTIDVADADVAGSADAFAVTATNVTGGADLVFDTALEEIDLTSTGTNDIDTDFAGTIDLAGSGSLTLSGTGGAAAASVIDASDYTGPLTVAVTNAAHTVTGGTGNDVITGATGTANTLGGGDGNDNITGGSAADTITAGDGTNTIDGNDGNDTITAGSGADDITGGSGDETITTGDGANTVDSEDGDDNITGGGGDDRIIFDTATDLTVADTVDPGAGTDTLVVTAADIDTNDALADNADLAALQAGMANFNVIEIGSQIGANAATDGINIARLATGAGTVNVLAATGATAATMTLNAGASTVNLNVAGTALGGNMTFVASGTGTTDSITVNNANAHASDRFNTQVMNFTGYETVTINSGDTTANTAQSTGAIAFTPTTNTASTINLTGSEVLTLGVVTQTGTSVLTIDASGMTAQAAGTTTVTVAAPVTSDGASIIGSTGEDVLNGDAGDVNTITGNGGDDTMNGGTAADSITGAAGADSLTGNGGADTLTGAGGNDTIIGGAGNDSIVGGEGADAITTAAGDDTVDGGAGNDTVTAAGNLTAADTLDGGADSDTLVLAAAATAGQAVNVSNFEVLHFDGTTNLSQDLFVFSNNNNNLTQLTLDDDDEFTFTNGHTTITTISLDETIGAETVSFGRLVDGTSNSLTITNNNGAVTQDITTLTVSDEETLTLNSATDNGTIDISTTLTAADATSLVLTGAGNVDINAITATANLATIDASALTGDATIGAGNVTADVTVTTGDGSTGTTNTVVTGSGDDTMTAGAGAVDFTGGAGADTLTGNAGADALAGGNGADSVDGGAANDTITGGTGADTLLGGNGADTITGGGGGDSIVGGTGADSLNGSAGDDTVTGGDGADHFQIADNDEDTVTITDFTDGTDIISIHDDVFGAAGGFGASASGGAVAAADYTTAATIALIGAATSANDEAIVEIQAAQTTAQIQLGTGGSADAVVLVFNSDTGVAELWADDDWSSVAGRVKLATIEDLDTLAKTIALTEADFFNM